MSERELVRIVKVDDVIPHPNADALELAIIGGWQCCVKIGEFKVGDEAMYFEIDSMLPLDNPVFEFLQGRNERMFEGKRYARIKTMKLRQELSQGLLLPMSAFNHYAMTDSELLEHLGIIKYEPALPACLAGNALGLFPAFIPKTDQERVQNIKRNLEFSINSSEEFEVTYKLDGSSFTAYVFRYNGEDDGIFTGVCSRNLELKIDESNEGNTFVKTFIENDLDAKLRQYHAETDKFIAIQGEMVGPGIQDNFEGLDKVELYVYSVFDIREQQYMSPNEARTAVKFMGLNYVPVFAERVTLTSLQDILTMADGESGLKGKFREGLVFKSLTRDFSFKAISNRYLLKTGR